MLKMLFETGHPWITFKDPCNVRSPQDHAGVDPLVATSAPRSRSTPAPTRPRSATSARSCSTSTSRPTASSTTRSCARPSASPSARSTTSSTSTSTPPSRRGRRTCRHRPVGLGVMGLQYALYRKGLAFGSRGGVEFNDEAMEAVAYYAYEASSDLAAERGTLLVLRRLEVGPRPAPAGHARSARGRSAACRSKSPRGGRAGLGAAAREDRHAGHAQLQRARDRADGHDREHHGHLALHRADVQEPVRQVEPVGRLHRAQPVPRRATSRPRPVERAHGRRAEARRRRPRARSTAIPAELRERYRTAFEIEPEWLIDAAARRQKWIDQSQSLNLFLAAAGHEGDEPHVPPRLARRPQDDVLPAHARRLDDREGHGAAPRRGGSPARSRRCATARSARPASKRPRRARRARGRRRPRAGQGAGGGARRDRRRRRRVGRRRRRRRARRALPGGIGLQGARRVRRAAARGADRRRPRRATRPVARWLAPARRARGHGGRDHAAPRPEPHRRDRRPRLSGRAARRPVADEPRT